MKTVLWIIVATLLASSPAGAMVGGGDVAFTVNGAAPVLFSHDTHVTQKKMKCSECHYALFTTKARHVKYTMAEMMKGKSCGACHNGERAFTVKANCQKCHSK